MKLLGFYIFVHTVVFMTSGGIRFNYQGIYLRTGIGNLQDLQEHFSVDGYGDNTLSHCKLGKKWKSLPVSNKDTFNFANLKFSVTHSNSGSCQRAVPDKTMSST